MQGVASSPRLQTVLRKRLGSNHAACSLAAMRARLRGNLRLLVASSLLITLVAGFVLLKEPGRIRLRSLLNIRPPDYPEAVQWLEQFYQQQAQEGKGHLRRIHSPSGSPPQAPAEECGAPELPRRSNLVVGTVGDGWDPSWWLSRPDRATFDLIVLYYGRNASFTCAGCTHIVHSRGPKWYLYYNLTESPLWQQLLERGYEYIMLPDDDLRMDTCQINTFFSALKEFSVVLGQPSVCRGEHSYTCWEELFQDPQYRLRYTNFIEIMAPALRFDFFQHVVRYTLEGTYTGYGLDFAWPALLHWPRNKVAVVDDICMVHPPSPPGGKPGGLYDVTGRFTQESGYQEQQRTNRKYNYWQPVVWSHGFLWKTPKIFGGVNKQQRYEQQQQQSGRRRGARNALETMEGFGNDHRHGSRQAAFKEGPILACNWGLLGLAFMAVAFAVLACVHPTAYALLPPCLASSRPARFQLRPGRTEVGRGGWGRCIQVHATFCS